MGLLKSIFIHKYKKDRLYLNKLDDVSKNPPPNKYVLIYTDNDEVKPVVKHKKRMNKKKSKYTLDQIGDALFEFIKVTNDNFKQVNTRIDRIEERLDYNGLKPLPSHK